MAKRQDVNSNNQFGFRCCMLCECYLTPLSPGYFALTEMVFQCLHTPFKIYTHTCPPPPCWGSKWSKITHSATQSLLCLALGTDCFIPQLFFFFPLFSLLPPPPPCCCIFFHTIVTLLKQEPAMVNCLTFLIVRWCFVVCPLCSGPYISRGLLFLTPLVCEILNRRSTCNKLFQWFDV